MSVAATSDANGWIFVAASFRSDSRSVEFMVDGALVRSFTTDSPVGTAASGLVVGASSSDAFGGFKGAVRSVFVYDVALSAAETHFLMTETVARPPAVVAGRWGYAFSQTSDRQQAFVAIDVAGMTQYRGAKTLAMWMAPTRAVPGDFCVCQLVAPDEEGIAATVWAYYSPQQATNFLRVRVEGVDGTAAEHLFPSLTLPADGAWHHLAVTWSTPRIELTVDKTLSVRLLPPYVRFDTAD